MVFIQLNHQLEVMKQMLQDLEEGFYVHPVHHLSGATIGAHTRHIIEMMDCMLKGYETGIIDYINRQRNLQLETDQSLAILEIERLQSSIKREDKPLEVVSEAPEATDIQLLKSSGFREMAYITEHTIHHMALIKAGLIELNSAALTDSFGVAYSTLKYRASLQQSH